MELHIALHGRRDIGRQIFLQIRELILTGQLRPGDPLPPTRELARQLAVARNTVVAVYERLCAEEFAESRTGAGTFVHRHVRPVASRREVRSPLRSRQIWDQLPPGRDMAAVRAEFDFRPGIPDVTRFPFAAWRTRLARQMSRRAVGSGAHTHAAGYPPLREAIARHLAVTRGVRATPDAVVITNGSQQAIDLGIRVLLEPGDVVAMEDPGYPLPRRAFTAYGCRVHGVPVDADGLVVDAIPRDARLVYVTPSHQYPLGMRMSLARRQALLAWADAADAAIIEDDYDGEFRYAGPPLETLQGLDRSGRVLYVGSLSKVLLPTLRLGFLVAPPPLHQAFAKAKHVTDWHTAVPLQGAAASFIADGNLARHLHRMRTVYADRHARIVRVLRRSFRDLATPLPSVGGLHCVAFLNRVGAHDDVPITENASALGVEVFPLSYHYVDSAPRAGLLLGYGAITLDRIEEGLRRLRSCL